MTPPRSRKLVEWPTLALIALCYGVWALSVSVMAEISLIAGIVVLALTITLHSSLQHETLHGNTLINERISEALVWLPVGLFIPFGRFKTTHLDHHRDARLTDPYDDPESNFLDPGHWSRLSTMSCAVLTFNNTLIGRMLIGPLVGQYAFMKCDMGAMKRGDWSVMRDWIVHGLGLIVLGLLLWRIGSMPVWAYLLAAYLGLSILKIRTYLEHRAHERASGRTVVIEDTGPLAFLFLNNNYHAVHHCHPALPWYDLPDRYRANKDEYLRRNDGYVYRSYRDVFRQHFWRGKDPVPHPLWKQN